MSKRVARSVALMVGAGALVLGAAAPAMAADVNVTSLPGKAKLVVANGDVAKVNAPLGMPCADVSEWTVRIPGKQDAVIKPTDLGCTGDMVTATINFSTTSNKKNAVVKFVGLKSAGGKVVKTVVVKVDRGGKPAKTGKPDSD